MSDVPSHRDPSHWKPPSLGNFDTNKCSLAEGRPCDACKEVKELDEEIQRVLYRNSPLKNDDHLKALSQKRQAILKGKINAIHDPLIRNLLTEIVTLVFEHFVDAQQPFSNGYTSRFSKADCSAPLVLSAVCRTWREIALDVPQLWTSPNIFLHSDYKLPFQQEILHEWLDRSRQLPLHVSYFCVRPLGSDFDAFSPLFDEVKAHAKRWKTLRLIFSRHCYPTFLTGLVHLPSLRHLQLWPRLDDKRGGPKFILPKSTKVKDLRIQNLLISDPIVDWSKVTYFHMRWISSDQIFELLRRAIKLEKCVFTDITRPIPIYSLPTFPIIHHSLKDLELHSSVPKELVFLLKNLTLPSLMRFGYSDTTPWDKHGTPHDFPLDPLLSFFTRSKCSLKAFEMQALYASTADKELVEVLEILSSVELLSLGSIGVHPSEGWLSDKFFTDDANFIYLSQLLPRLKNLHISGTRAFSWDGLLAFLNLAHLHITAKQRNRINVRLELDVRPGHPFDYISPRVVSQLTDSIWDKTIALQILDRKKREDLIQASLEYHGRY